MQGFYIQFECKASLYNLNATFLHTIWMQRFHTIWMQHFFLYTIWIQHFYKQFECKISFCIQVERNISRHNLNATFLDNLNATFLHNLNVTFFVSPLRTQHTWHRKQNVGWSCIATVQGMAGPRNKTFSPAVLAQGSMTKKTQQGKNRGKTAIQGREIHRESSWIDRLTQYTTWE